MNKYEIKSQLVVESILFGIKKLNTIENELFILKQVNQLLYNVFLIGKDFQESVQKVFQNQDLFSESNGSVYLLPTTQDEKNHYFLSELGIFLEKMLPTNSQAEFNESLEITFSLIQNRRFINEEIPIFLNYLFNPPDPVLTYELKLKLYLILSEEYHKILLDRDISSMAILGQKTIQMIINGIFTNISEDSELNLLPREKLTILMKRFFIIVTKTVQKLTPN